ncbi:TPA: DUF1642 domain-containing protein [Streptococcus suis]|nr:DUF1642 domain-containing protein [Streptococcus suis]
MNKQEAIEQLEYSIGRITEFGRALNVVPLEKAKYIISQIHEPQKVVVPKYIADKIEYCKTAEGYGLFHTMDYCYNYKDSAEWLECNQETFARAWLFGYEVEKEKLYEVTVPGTSNYKNQKQYLVKQGKHWFFCGNDVNRFKYRFTKGQIEAAGFGWVFDCNGVKVVEVDG